jgi:hypothetical protein
MARSPGDSLTEKRGGNFRFSPDDPVQFFDFRLAPGMGRRSDCPHF